MKLCIVTPNEEYVGQAGARIRYRRLADPLRLLGYDLFMRPIGSLRGRDDLDADVFLLSKCHDARAVLLAKEARRLGRPVGIDLFDDYFSQIEDSRFSRLRAWFAAAADAADFILCSTPAMQAVAAAHAPPLPSHVMSDPFERFDTTQLAGLLAEKRERVAATGLLEVAWFGTGDNPHFPVGLADLAAFSDGLRALSRGGLRVVLHVLTNRRAMTPDALAALARLPVQHTLETWTEAGEAALLARCYAAFLPVNAQPFSVAKSLNRAVTALTAGTQVLSLGYPLYSLISGFLYRDPLELVRDARAGQARLRPETLADFGHTLQALADPAREAAGLSAFLSALTPPAGAAAPPHGFPAAVVHGRESTPAVHEFARAFGALSVASPLASQPLDYDIQVLAGKDGFEVLVHGRIADRITDGWLMPPAGKGAYRRVRMNSAGDVRTLDLCRLSHPRVQAVAHAAAHSGAMAQVARIMDALFPGLPLVLSEDFRLAWPLPPGFPGASLRPLSDPAGNPADVLA